MMQLTVTYWSGGRAEAVLLAVYGLRMRAAVCGCSDATEFRYVGGQWFDESGDPVQIEEEGACGEKESVPASAFQQIVQAGSTARLN